ncbi:MAG: hypothetical protein ACT4QE_26725 [Anaerolineales bacterium]
MVTPGTPAQPPTEWAVQLLTARYIVEGALPIPETRLVGHLNNTAHSTLTLHNAQLLALGAQATHIRNPLPEVTIPKPSLIVLIPRDAASIRSATLQIPERTERAIIHTGPYLIRGAFHLPGNMPLQHLFNVGGGDMLPLTEVEIKCQLLGARITTLHADILVLNKAAVHLYHPGDEFE